MTRMEVRETFENLAPMLGRAELLVYLYLSRLEDGDYPTQSEIARKCWVSDRQVIRAIKVLTECGLLGVERKRMPEGRHTRNFYTVIREK